MDTTILASELLRALRGRRSQAAFSRRLGCKSNIAYAWESGRRFPTAAGMFRAAERVGVDLQAGLRTFFRTPPPWLARVDLTQPQGVVQLLTELRAAARISELAQRTGISRFALSRWFKGATEPRLPDFLLLVEACSLRLLDFIAALTDPLGLPSIAADWQRLDDRRRLAYEVPWTQAVLIALELQSYRALPGHQPGWIAARLGIDPDDEAHCLKMLERTGQIRRAGRHFVPVHVATVDTRRDAAAGRQLKRFWARAGLERLEAGAGGQFSYNVFTVSEADYERLQELQANYYQEMRRIVAASTDCERVVLTNLQLVPLDGDRRPPQPARPGPRP